MKKKVYCITNNQGLFYNKSDYYKYNVPSFTSGFQSLFTLYKKPSYAMKVVDELNKQSKDTWEIKEVTITI